jgi:photosystem II stability/assembly factor-like uncharacterized protein
VVFVIDAIKVRRLLIGVSLIALLGLAACGDPQPTPVVPGATATATGGPPDGAGTATPATGEPADTPVTQPTGTAAPAPTDTIPAGPTVTPVILPTVTPAAPAPTNTAAPAPTDTAPPAPTETAVPPVPTDTAAPAPTDTAAPAPTDTAVPTPTTPAASRPEWRRVASGRVEGLANAPGGAIYAAGQEGVSRSTDGGVSWTRLPGGFEADFVAVAPSDPRVIYAGTGEGCFSGFEGTLYRSADSGATWTAVTGGPFDLDINPADPNRLVALNCGNLVRSTDGGRTWTDLPGTIAPNFTPHILARGVNNRATIYVVFASEGGSIQILRTTDDARSWQTLNTPDFYGPHDFVVDPLDARHIYLVAGSGFYASANGGNSWNRLSTGLEATNSDLGGFLQLTGLALDRVSPPPRGATATLYVGSYGTDRVPPAGVFRWNAVDRWVPAAPAPDGQNITTLLATAAPNQPALLAATEQGVYRWPLNVGGQ